MRRDDEPGDETSPTNEKPRRRRRATASAFRPSPELEALADFVRALEQMTPTAQRAAINWLTDRYLRAPARARGGES